MDEKFYAAAMAYCAALIEYDAAMRQYDQLEGGGPKHSPCGCRHCKDYTKYRAVVDEAMDLMMRMARRTR